MTLIASITYNKSPTILIGDLLETIDSKEEIKIKLPSGNGTEDINQTLEQLGKKQISNIVQKLNLLSDRLCVAVSGDAAQAKDLIETLSFIANDKNLKLQLLNKVLSCIEPSRINQIQAIIHLVEIDPCNPSSFRTVRVHNSSVIKKQYKGDISTISGGSGANTFDKAMNLINWKAYIKNNRQTDRTSILNFAGILLSSHFHAMEITYGTNLVDSWGGGIEIVTANDGKLKKIDHILHIFIDAEQIGKNGKYMVNIRNKFIKYQYFEDLLMIRTFDLVMQEDTSLGSSDYISLIPPITKKLNDYDLNKICLPSLKGKFLAFHIYVKGKTIHQYIKYCDHFIEDFSIEPDFSHRCLNDLSKINSEEKRNVNYSQKLLNEIGEFLKSKGINVEEREDMITRFSSKT